MTGPLPTWAVILHSGQIVAIGAVDEDHARAIYGYDGHIRDVELYDPLRHLFGRDLREWKIASGYIEPDAVIIPVSDGPIADDAADLAEFAAWKANRDAVAAEQITEPFAEGGPAPTQDGLTPMQRSYMVHPELNIASPYPIELPDGSVVDARLATTEELESVAFGSDGTEVPHNAG